MTISPQEVERIARDAVGGTSKQAAQHVFLLQATMPEDATLDAFLEIENAHLGFLRTAVRDGFFQAGLFPDEYAVAHFVGTAERLFTEEYLRLCRSASRNGRGRA